jgi:sigma-E factor negative regulatory protein RseC
MLQEKGTVVALRGDNAIVQTQNQLSCGSCKVSSSCGNGIVEQYLSAKLFESELKNTIKAKVGQKVLIQISKSSVTQASLIVYFIPLLFLLSAALISELIQHSENMTILMGLSGLIFGLLVTKYYNHKWLKNELYLPKIVCLLD